MSWNTPKFEIGEQVQLQSGGGAMTIEAIDGDSIVTCVWRDKTGRVRRDCFPKACLRQSSEADAHIIFMPESMMNQEGTEAFLRGDFKPEDRH